MLTWFAGRGFAATVEPFNWSGRNTVSARRAAGLALAERLDQIHRDAPSAALFVIAHSHGGSVFAYSIKLRPQLIDIVNGFVALATPWIGLQPSSFASALRRTLFKLGLNMLFVMSLLGVPFVAQWLVALDPSPQIIAYVDALVALGYSLLGAGIIALLLFYPLQRILMARLERSVAGFEQHLESVAQDASTWFERLPPSVFLKPIGDEAALALTWTSASAALMQGVSILLLRLVQWTSESAARIPRKLRIAAGLLLTTAWSVGTTVGVIAVYWQEDPSAVITGWAGGISEVLVVFVIWSLIAWAAVLLTATTVIVLLLVALVAAIGAGMPSLGAALYLRIGVEPVPVGKRRLILVDVSSPQGLGLARVGRTGLSHSALYDSPDAICTVIEALSEFLGTAPDQRTPAARGSI